MISDVLSNPAGVQISILNLMTQAHECLFLSLFSMFLSCNSLSCLSLILSVSLSPYL